MSGETIDYSSSLADILSDFKKRGIDTSKPGFYDSPEFLKAENECSEYLSCYGRFVDDRERSRDYEEKAAFIVPLISNFFYEKLKTSGRLGACVDISLLLSRALEKAGIWNYAVKGSLTIEFKHARLPPEHFWTLDEKNASAPHAWVVAPPYQVIDLSARLQPYDQDQGRFLPDFVIGRELPSATPKIEDLISSNLRAYFASRRMSDEEQFGEVRDDLLQFLRTFPARTMDAPNVKLRYIPVGITAPNGPFEAARPMLFEGRSAHELYVSELQPVLSRTSAT